MYPNEVMTGYLNKDKFQPISRMTVRALADLGYQVDLSKADEFNIGLLTSTSSTYDQTMDSRRRRLRETTVSTSKATAEEDLIPLKNDLYLGPVTILD
jgi:hypothetical protein